jgi:hypothetical protein
MNVLNNELSSLLNWEIYADEEKFKNYINKNDINPKDTISLIAAHRHLREASQKEYKQLENTDIIDKALEIKLKHEYEHMSKNFLMRNF